MAHQWFIEDGWDEDGSINRYELKKTIERIVEMCELDILVQKEFVQKVFDDVDIDKDKKISIGEFKSYCVAALKQIYWVLD